MNKFSKQIVLGLSCLGALSVVSCDNETETPKVPPVLEKVSFSSVTSDVTFADGQKVTLNIKDGDNEAKYYTDNDRVDGTPFGEDGTKFTFNADKSIQGGFYLESDENPGKAYTLTKFDYTLGTGDDAKNYTLKKNLDLNVVTGTTTKVAVDVVEKKDGTVTSAGKAKGTHVGFNVSDATDPLSFKVKLKKSDGTFFNSKDDKDVTIKFDVKDNNKEVYGAEIASLFQVTDLPTEGAKIFTITLPREKDYYSDKLTFKATAKNGESDHNFETLTSTSLKGSAILETKVSNNAPVITNKGASESGYPTQDVPKTGSTIDTSKDKVTFNLRSQTSQILVFQVTDEDNDTLNTTYQCELWKSKNNKIIGDSDDERIKTINQFTVNSGKIKPSEITVGTGHRHLSGDPKTDIEKYYIKVTVTTDDGLGGKTELNDVIFYLTK